MPESPTRLDRKILKKIGNKHEDYMDTSIKRDHPLYERHLEYLCDVSYQKWFSDRRREDKIQWEGLRREIEIISDMAVESKSEVLSHKNHAEKEKQILKQQRKEEKRLQKIAKIEARKANEIAMAQAAKLFYGSSREKFFKAWKEYAAFMKVKREKDKCLVM